MSERAFVLGGGRFGTNLASRLCELGWEVVIADRDPARVKSLAEDGFHAIELDIEDPEGLREAGVAEADVAVVALGERMQTAILATLTLKDLKVKRVVARAVDNTEARVLDRVGADLVVMPTRDMAHELAERLRSDALSDRALIGRDYQFAQIRLGPALLGKTLAEVSLRQSYRVNVVLVTRAAGEKDAIEMEPTPDLRFEPGDVVGVVAKRSAIEQFEQDCGVRL